MALPRSKAHELSEKLEFMRPEESPLPLAVSAEVKSTEDSDEWLVSTDADQDMHGGRGKTAGRHVRKAQF